MGNVAGAVLALSVVSFGLKLVRLGLLEASVLDESRLFC